MILTLKKAFGFAVQLQYTNVLESENKLREQLFGIDFFSLAVAD